MHVLPLYFLKALSLTVVVRFLPYNSTILLYLHEYNTHVTFSVK